MWFIQIVSKKYKPKAFQVRLDPSLESQVREAARKDFSTPPRFVSKIVTIFFHPRRK